MILQQPFLLYLGDATSPLAVKTSRGIAQWRPDLCIGEYSNKNCTISLNVEQMTPEVAKKKGAKTFIVGLANSGGKIAESWISDIIIALEQGMDVASGLHQKLVDIEIIRNAAIEHGCQIHDVRHFTGAIPVGTGKKRSGKRLLTVGTDCSVGKMYTSLAIEREMKQQGFDVEFKATGQSGLLLGASGICVDAVVADFISGAIELISPDAAPEHWDIIEGQGSLFNPSFAGVSTGLLHGAQSDLIVMCHEAGRQFIKDLEGYKLPDLKQCIEHNLTVGRLTNPNIKLAGISLNCRLVGKEKGLAMIKDLEKRFGVPCFDPILTGVKNLVDTL
ncbi:MAG: DUF1611 domain-containing protein [Thalassotalea sp.]|uniref:N-acetyltransferase DgcN n=1 Tax=uncultured Paraglaciecola sp. TaxID=1765024 RepID=UPI0026134A3C|nr:N-acetyltransferase DgcN [uncultured Paraglaciecola sp.]MDG1752273.1 DUF1611 domain-containing protein [Thalassotalea sp.]